MGGEQKRFKGIARTEEGKADWDCIVFSDELCFQLCRDDHGKDIQPNPAVTPHRPSTRSYGQKRHFFRQP
ncbi:hypothetical protein TNCV_4360591 [Trichonephila clavipes]|uniref:Uncharacterized protein n=1 Tax=Trichonephila clavipes TaxID=2585209 RepID=A0A8X6WAT0_TRICX|nr:hypothetical protein TNCV_4360591 [Trichonephila clavipes]